MLKLLSTYPVMDTATQLDTANIYAIKHLWHRILNLHVEPIESALIFLLLVVLPFSPFTEMDKYLYLQ